jgi:hypothetical protein
VLPNNNRLHLVDHMRLLLVGFLTVVLLVLPVLDLCRALGLKVWEWGWAGRRLERRLRHRVRLDKVLLPLVDRQAEVHLQRSEQQLGKRRLLRRSIVSFLFFVRLS